MPIIQQTVWQTLRRASLDIIRGRWLEISDGGRQTATKRLDVGVTALQYDSFVPPCHQQDGKHHINIVPTCVVLCEQVPHSFMLREKEKDVLFLAVVGDMGQAGLFSMSTR